MITPAIYNLLEGMVEFMLQPPRDSEAVKSADVTLRGRLMAVKLEASREAQENFTQNLARSLLAVAECILGVQIHVPEGTSVNKKLLLKLVRMLRNCKNSRGLLSEQSPCEPSCRCVPLGNTQDGEDKTSWILLSDHTGKDVVAINPSLAQNLIAELEHIISDKFNEWNTRNATSDLQEFRSAMKNHIGGESDE